VSRRIELRVFIVGIATFQCVPNNSKQDRENSRQHIHRHSIRVVAGPFDHCRGNLLHKNAQIDQDGQQDVNADTVDCAEGRSSRASMDGS
jgi:hypothetical protein